MSRSEPRALPPFLAVGRDKVRHLRDGAQAYPAMIEAIAAAEREVLLEMYWISADRAGERFRAALVDAAIRGIRVCVLYDAIGSITLPAAFWRPLLDAGGRVSQWNPLSPFSADFRVNRLNFRDHRKLLVVDGDVGITGGLNIAAQWLPKEDGGDAWRDDAIQVHGPAARELRDLFYKTWKKCGGAVPSDVGASRPAPRKRVWVMADHINVRPDRSIRRAYLWAIRRARRSVDIASAYFLPGPLFLRALQGACRRGVRVRILIPERGDVWVVSQAMSSLVGRFLAGGVQVFAYRPAVLHAKTAIIDDRFVTIGSHNLDAYSLRYNLECNLAVDDGAFASTVRASFDRDLLEAAPLTSAAFQGRPWASRVTGRLASLFHKFL